MDDSSFFKDLSKDTERPIIDLDDSEEEGILDYSAIPNYLVLVTLASFSQLP